MNNGYQQEHSPEFLPLVAIDVDKIHCMRVQFIKIA